MSLRTWLNLLGKKLAARFTSHGPDAYPTARLLPRPSYRLLLPPNHHVSTGWLLRRTTGKNVFAPAAGGRQVLHDPKQLCDAPNHLSDGFSVSLWGRFLFPDNGWKNTKAAREKLYKPWEPGQATLAPTTDEMHYLTPETWDVVGFDIATLKDFPLDVTEFGRFYASVHHAPNCWNYWHYEVRFYELVDDTQKRWLHEPGIPYKNKGLKRLQANLLDSFIQAGLAQPISSVLAPVPLRRTTYDTRPPWWARLLGC